MSKILNETLDMIFPHEDNCGHCEHGRIDAKFIFNRDESKVTVQEAADQARAAWQQTKYYKFAQECRANGLDWQEEFMKKGWQP